MDTRVNAQGDSIPFVSKEIVEHLKKRYSPGVMLSEASYKHGNAEPPPSESYKLGYISGMTHIITYLSCLQYEQEEEALKGGE